MGACCEGVGNITVEEIAFLKRERSLGFIQHSATEIDYIIRKYATGLVIQETNLHMIETALGFNFGNLKDSKNSVKRFLDTLRAFEGYDYKTILILGIFLSNSQPKIKARLWFEALDIELKLRLLDAQVEELLRTLYKITFKSLPLLAVSEGLEASIVQMYTERWELNLETFVAETKNGIIMDRGIINKEEFIDSISGCYSNISNPSGLRKFLKQRIAFSIKL